MSTALISFWLRYPLVPCGGTPALPPLERQAQLQAGMRRRIFGLNPISKCHLWQRGLQRKDCSSRATLLIWRDWTWDVQAGTQPYKRFTILEIISTLSLSFTHLSPLFFALFSFLFVFTALRKQKALCLTEGFLIIMDISVYSSKHWAYDWAKSLNMIRGINKMQPAVLNSEGVGIWLFLMPSVSCPGECVSDQLLWRASYKLKTVAWGIF